MNDKHIFIFTLSLFLILSISGAGIFINDEWMVGQQLNQLSQGHQLLHNEGKYGYYTNGSASNYMSIRSNVLIYSLTLPIISLPAYILFTLLSTTYTRIFLIGIWGLCGLICLNILKRRDLIKYGNISEMVWILFVFINIAISSPFIMQGDNIPYEIIPIVFTNICLFGIFSVLCFKISEILFSDSFKQIVSWISCIAMTSLIFWCTTLKDHMLITTVIIAICYLHLKHNVNGDYSFIKYILAGLSLWIRPEVGLFVIISVILFDLYYYKIDIYKFISIIYWTSLGSLPLVLNNMIVTGNPLSHPFLLSTTNQTSGNMISQVMSGSTQIPFAQLVASSYDRWIELIFVPSSGALGLIVPLCLFFFAVLTLIKHRQQISLHSKFLFIVGISSILYYLLYSGAYLSADGGVIPDIRYFTAAYTPLTLFALSILPYDLNYKKVFKNIIIITPIIIIISLFMISVYPPAGETFKSYRMIVHIISTLVLSLSIILLVNDKNDNPSKWLERLIPVAIASAFTWQIIMLFVYHISKAHYYPMFIPATEIIYKLLFGV